MKLLIRWFIDNPVAANLLMWLLLMGGVLSIPSLHQEEFPSMETDTVNITVVYPGASPAEVEEAVCVRIEEAIEGIVGIDKIVTRAGEGSCRVSAELLTDINKNKVVNDIKSNVDNITTFPSETERPLVSEFTITGNVAKIAISGHAEERTLKRIGERVREDLLARSGISQVSLLYVRPYEISIEVSEYALRRYGITFDTVAAAIKDSSIDLPAGAIKAQGGEVLVRTREQAYTGEEFKQVVVLTRNDGTRLTLGDIATVKDSFEDMDLYARFNGLPTVIINVKRVGDEDIIAIAEAVHDYADSIEQWLPTGIEATVWDDQSADLVERLSVLANNAIGGLLLVSITLSLFLRRRLAFWVAVGLPIAILGTLATFPALNISISTLSVISFIMVIGILVDDAIVVGERVYAHHQRGLSWKEAAVVGTQEVTVPVMFGVFTSAATFLPLLMIPGAMSAFFSVIGAVVIIALVFSIIESQLILPAHLAYQKTTETVTADTPWRFLQQAIANSMENVVKRLYRPALRKAIAARYLTLATGISVIIITVAMTIGGWITVQFFPAIAGNNIFVSLTMPEGTPISVTSKAVAQLEQAAEQLRDELDRDLEPGQPSRVRFVFSSIGSTTGADSFSGETSGGAHIAEVQMEIETGTAVPSSTIVANRWRELTGSIPDALELTFSSSTFSAGSPIDIELRGKSFDDLRAVATELRQVLARYDGVFDISDSFRGGKQEIQLKLLPEARNLGLTSADLARQVRQAFYGDEVQRIQRGQDDIKVMVRYPQAERRSISDLEQMRIRTADGAEIPFASVAQMSLARGYSTIRREDGERIVRVLANIDRKVTTPEEVLDSIERSVLPELLQRYPSVNYHFGGEAEQRGGAVFGLIKNFLLCLLLVYALLAIPLKSYLQPLVIMSVIPFGAVSALLGHFIIGQPLVFFSLLGIVALSGVVVNASLVMVDYVNRKRREGVELIEAVIDAGCVRFRPIVLTSLTTFVGLLPLILSPSLEIRFFMPMAISLAFGVLFSTAITLFLIPCLYLIMEDFFSWMGVHDRSEAKSGADNKLAVGQAVD